MVENSFSLSDSSVIEIGFIHWMWLENVVLLIGMDCKHWSPLVLNPAFVYVYFYLHSAMAYYLRVKNTWDEDTAPFLSQV